MRFRLTYKGRLKGQKRDRQHVQDLRSHFHKQLQLLWAQEPLSGYRDWLEANREPLYYSVIEDIGGFQFAPLVSSRVDLISELDILLLRPAPPGAILRDGGDLDNRIKTLVDGLRLPTKTELPPNWRPEPDQLPFFCLLQDEKLVSGFSVVTDRLLEPDLHEQEALIIVHVRVTAIKVTMGNSGLVG